jgi:hypothetical protein
MKKTSIIIAALAFLVTLTQCKKEQQVTPANEGVAITLDIMNSNSSRMDVNTATGAVTYESGDVIYVASGGRYVGTLTHNGTRFSGTISDPTVGEPLDFYFLGNVTPAETLTAGTTQTCSVVISDQTERLPVIEYAPSNENYTAGASAFSAHLLNKCALVKFNVTTSSSAATCITGFNNKVTVDFTTNTLTPSKEGTGIIKLAAGNGEKWAILLPQNAIEAGPAYSADGVYNGTCAAVPAITDNGYLTAGVDVTVTTEINPGEVPVGAICGKFTINENGDQVYFSQGNLQYNKTTAVWSFMEHQYDMVETNWQDVGENYANQNIVSLFGWGTSGWNNGNMYYQPYDTESFWDVDTGYGYGPTDGTNYNLTGDYANADWGVYNAISNGGNTPNQWRTLTIDEWCYVFDNRSTPSGIRYAKAVVNGVNGVILLPDDWSVSVYALNYTNRSNAPYTTNEVTAESWATMETAGAVFLPAAGYRHEDTTSAGNVGNCGNYWSSSLYQDAYPHYARYFDFNSASAYMSHTRHYYGHSVRLVCEN